MRFLNFIFAGMALLLVTARAAEPEKSVVQIFVASQLPVWDAPWRFESIRRSSGTGFLIKGKRILTNAHVVSWGRQILVKKYQDPRPYQARVVFVGHDCDLAVLEIEDPNFMRGMEALMPSESRLAMVGPENLEANLQAFAKAMGTQLQLLEVYGLAETVQTESGLTVDVFRALLAMKLMTAFFVKDFLRPYSDYLVQLGDARLALGRLAFGGLQGDMQNRFPITWSDKAAKIERIKLWTVSSEFPRGHAKAAEAILDFWTCDWLALSARLRGNEPGLQPTLLERPMLKMGRHLFQLPWMVALQNNATAAINNLRRLGSHRMEAQGETRRIEQRLGEQFERRGFRVLGNYQPAVRGDVDAGEIDLLCARDGHLLVLEVKSTFLRRSKKDAWVHGTTTLRKAGLQLRRKLRAVNHALASDLEFSRILGLSPADGIPAATGWIVDTSIECDHQRFSGFFKVSLEEVLIALRDERRLLNDPDGLLRQKREDGESLCNSPCWTLYADGFSATRFIEVIERELVWAIPT